MTILPISYSAFGVLQSSSTNNKLELPRLRALLNFEPSSEKYNPKKMKNTIREGNIYRYCTTAIYHCYCRNFYLYRIKKKNQIKRNTSNLWLQANM